MPTVVPLTTDHLPTLLDLWEATQVRSAPPWVRPLAERRALVAGRLRAAARGGDGARALVALGDGTPVAYLIGRAVRLPRGSTYLTYVPAHFLNIGADDWGAASPADAPLLPDLYGEVAAWAVARGADAHLVAVAPGDPLGDLWADLGFARHDSYAFLPTGAARPGPAEVAVRRAAPGDLDAATALIVAEARHHHAAPIFAHAPPGLEGATRRDLAEALGDDGAVVLLAEQAGMVAGAIVAYRLAGAPSWAASALPTPCLYIESAYVRPEARGRGLLRALVAGLAEAAPADTAGLFVTYLPANLPAARAWVALGFQPFALIRQRRLDPRAARQWRAAGR